MLEKLTGSPVYDTPIMRQLAQMTESLKPALRKVAEFILRNPIRVATLNIEEIAQATGASTAAVNRLANAMGLSGFTGLRLALVENLLTMVSPVDKVRQELVANPDAGFGLEQQVRLSKGNLDSVLEMNTEPMFCAMVEQLLAARRIYIVGFGNSAFLAGLAAASLVPYCSQTVSVSVEGGAESAAYRMATIGPGDVLLAIALPAYTRDTLRLAQFASERGACVLGLTDSAASPLTRIARHTLFVPPGHPILNNSKSALLAVIEALAAAVRLGNKRSVKRSIELAEDALAYLHAEGGSLSAQPLAGERILDGDKPRCIAGPAGD